MKTFYAGLSIIATILIAWGVSLLGEQVAVSRETQRLVREQSGFLKNWSQFVTLVPETSTSRACVNSDIPITDPRWKPEEERCSFPWFHTGTLSIEYHISPMGQYVERIGDDRSDMRSTSRNNFQ